VSLVFGVFGFPAGFTMIVTCGAELFTSLCAYTAAAWWEGKVTAAASLRLLVVSWLGNCAGCAIFLGLIEAAGMFEGRDAYLLMLAGKKVHHSFGSAFVRAVFANWCVDEIGCCGAHAGCYCVGSGRVLVWLPPS
jgi:formate/nitrite transporter FocA (FNT family)